MVRHLLRRPPGGREHGGGHEPWCAQVTDGPRARLTALAVAALVLAACSNPGHHAPTAAGSSAEPAVRQVGSVTVALDQEPATFNPRTTRGNTTATRDVVRSVLPSVWTINDKF